ncbi:MAG: hypothetical protein J3K34DRAFT_491868 [Monoraphidium minutum]|nr:MAG: hypothetical protein J3K34DRAFT_491868 [Monoraphidium minutum]
MLYGFLESRDACDAPAAPPAEPLLGAPAGGAGGGGAAPLAAGKEEDPFLWVSDRGVAEPAAAAAVAAAGEGDGEAGGPPPHMVIEVRPSDPASDEPAARADAAGAAGEPWQHAACKLQQRAGEPPAAISRRLVPGRPHSGSSAAAAAAAAAARGRSASPQRPLGKFPARSGAAAGQGPQSPSPVKAHAAYNAAREDEAFARHVKRSAAAAASPGVLTPAAAQSLRSGPAPPAPRRAKSAPRLCAAAAPAAGGGGAAAGGEPAHERLYRLGVSRVAARGAAAAAPPPAWLGGERCRAAMLSEDEWGRVAARMHDEARARAERMAAAAHQAVEARAASPPARPRSAGPSYGRGGGGAQRFSGGQSSFLARQRMFEAERARKLQRHQQALERQAELDFEQTCTFAPAINSGLAPLGIERTVERMRAWEEKRRINTYLAAAAKEELAYEGATFSPVINAHSRNLALRSWAARPDPRRPWTAAPAVTSPPREGARQYVPPEWRRTGSPTERAAEQVRAYLGASMQLPGSPGGASGGGGGGGEGGEGASPPRATRSSLHGSLGPTSAGGPAAGGWAAGLRSESGGGAAPQQHHPFPQAQHPGATPGRAIVQVAPGDGIAFVHISLPSGLARARPQPPHAPAGEAAGAAAAAADLRMSGAWRSAAAGGAGWRAPGAGAPPSAGGSPLSSTGGGPPPGAGAGPGRKAPLSSGGGGKSGAVALALRAQLASGAPLQPTLSQAMHAALALAEAEEAGGAGGEEAAAALGQYMLARPGPHADAKAAAAVQEYARRAAAAQGGAAGGRPLAAAYYLATDRVQPAGGAAAAALAAAGGGKGKGGGGNYSKLHGRLPPGGAAPGAGGGNAADSDALLHFLQHMAPRPPPAAPPPRASPPPVEPYSRAQIARTLSRPTAPPAPPAASALWVGQLLAAAAGGGCGGECGGDYNVGAAPAAALQACDSSMDLVTEGRQVVAAALAAAARSAALETRSMPYGLDGGSGAVAAAAAVSEGAWEASLAAAEAGEGTWVRRDIESGAARAATASDDSAGGGPPRPGGAPVLLRGRAERDAMSSAGEVPVPAGRGGAAGAEWTGGGGGEWAVGAEGGEWEVAVGSADDFAQEQAGEEDDAPEAAPLQGRSQSIADAIQRTLLEGPSPPGAGAAPAAAGSTPARERVAASPRLLPSPHPAAGRGGAAAPGSPLAAGGPPRASKLSAVSAPGGPPDMLLFSPGPDSLPAGRRGGAGGASAAPLLFDDWEDAAPAAPAAPAAVAPGAVLDLEALLYGGGAAPPPPEGAAARGPPAKEGKQD